MGLARFFQKKFSFRKRCTHINSERSSDWPNQVHVQILSLWYILRGTEICVYHCGYKDEGKVVYWLGLLLAISESQQSKQKG